VVKGLELKPRGVFGEAAIAALIGLSAELPPSLPAKERGERLQVVIDAPKVEVRKAYYRADKPPGPIQVSAPQSKLQLEILVKEGAKYVPRPVETRHGEAFVPLKRNEVYAVQLSNDHDFEIAARLTIDGLSIFAFADGVRPGAEAPQAAAPLHSVIIAPHGTVLVPGWYRNRDQMNEFLVTEYARTAAAELKSVAEVGSITASYCASWPVNGKPPADEPQNPSRFARSADGTARGLLIRQQSETIERTLGVVRGFVTVRYTKPAA
jgi:hypothetical protein